MRDVTFTGPAEEAFDVETRRIDGTLLVDGRPPKMLRACTAPGAGVDFWPQTPYAPPAGAAVPRGFAGMTFAAFTTTGTQRVEVTGLPWNYLENKPKPAFTNVPQTSVIVLPALKVR